MNPITVDLTEEAGEADEFDLSLNRLVQLLLDKGSVPVVDESMLVKLRETFGVVSAAGSDVCWPIGWYVACLRCLEDGVTPCETGEPVVIIDRRLDYSMLVSLEISGHSYMMERQYQDAYNCYRLAYMYYADRFDRYFVKSRLLKKMVAKALLEWGQYEAVLAELKEDIGQDSYGTVLDAEATLYIKYAYGRALLSKNEFSEAIPYLSQSYLGEMDIEDEDNMGVLRATLQLVLDQAARDNVQFAMEAALGLLEIFETRLRRGHCPGEVFEFAFHFSRQLWTNEREDQFLQLSSLASRFQADSPNPDTTLLLSAIDCSSPERKAEAWKNVLRYHNELCSGTDMHDAFSRCRLNLTMLIIDLWE